MEISKRLELCRGWGEDWCSAAFVPLRRPELCRDGEKIGALWGIGDGKIGGLSRWGEDLSSVALVPLRRLELCGNGED